MAVKKTETKTKKSASSEPEKKAKAVVKKVPAVAKAVPSSDDPSAYNNDSITLLKGADRVRKRPSVIFGSDNIEGCKHCFFEILANAIDESNAGYGREIRVSAYNDHSMKVEDFGRGVPLGFNEKEGRYNWELVFCELFAGGKMDNNTDEAVYKSSLGTNGLGACATQYASSFMTVDSFDGKFVSSIRFEKGEPVTELERFELAPSDRRTGTVIHWRPDLEVFTDINIPTEYFKEVLHRQAAINYGVRFLLEIENDDGKFENFEYFYSAEDGLREYLCELAENKFLTEPVFWQSKTRGKDRGDRQEYPLEADYVFCFTQAIGVQEYYHNSSYLEHGGSPDKAVRAAFVSAIDKYLRDAGKYNKNETKVNFTDIADSLVLVISSHSTVASYENQTKKAITNSFIQESMTDVLKEKLATYFVEKPQEAEKIAAQVLLNKRSRESAEKSRIDIKKKLTATMDVSYRVEKFVGCRSKDPSIRELYIVEGDSALTSCKLAREAEFQAIIPVRGKTLNCMKSDYKQIFASEIIVDLLRVIGCGVELDSKAKKHSDMSDFDLSALKWSKIIICTDADEDGFQIRTLLLTMFYRLLPTLIEEGKIFIAETPLYEITTKDDTYFAYDEKEKAEILKKIGDKKYTLQRSKGLGENEADMMSRTTMKPATRRLIAVKPADAAATEEIFDVLLGNNLAGRKTFIAEHAGEYMKDVDV
jgi:DNA gyrase subunit B